MEKAGNAESEPSKEEMLDVRQAQSLNVSDGLDIIVNLDKNNIVQGFIMSEILSRPRALNSRGRFLWNSRF